MIPRLLDISEKALLIQGLAMLITGTRQASETAKAMEMREMAEKFSGEMEAARRLLEKIKGARAVQITGD